LLENTAITIGRLGFGAADVIAPHLEKFVQSWCSTLRFILDDVEKESAFRGLCKLIKANPDGAVKSFFYVADAIASWEQPAKDLKDMFFAILHGFKNSMDPRAWQEFFGMFPERLRNNLHESYQL